MSLAIGQFKGLVTLTNTVVPTWDSFNDVSFFACFTTIKFFKHVNHVLPDGSESSFAFQQGNFAYCVLA